MSAWVHFFVAFFFFVVFYVYMYFCMYGHVILILIPIVCAIFPFDSRRESSSRSPSLSSRRRSSSWRTWLAKSFLPD
jgi:hypothetical protein